MSTLFALASFVGTIIGVGMFGLPYVASKVGLLPMIAWTFLITGLMLLIHLMYGEIVLRTPGSHRLPGFCQIYLRPWVAKLSLVITAIGFYGSLLAYLLIGGAFLTTLLAPMFGGSVLFWTTVYLIVGCSIFGIGSRAVGRTELVSMICLFVLLIVLYLATLGDSQFVYFMHTSTFDAFLPYGVLVFALSGGAVIPEIRDQLGRHQEKHLYTTLVIGTFVPAVVYIFYCLTVLGVTGAATTPDSLTGLLPHLPRPLVVASLLIGILVTFTSFITLGITLKKQFQHDAGFHPAVSWALVAVPPYLLFLFGYSDFIGLLGFVGAVILGFDLILISLIYLVAQKWGSQLPAYQLRLNATQIRCLVGLIGLGICIELIRPYFVA